MNKQIGLRLQQVRRERSLTLEQVSEATLIRVHYLQAIEAGEFEKIPSATQARGFIRNYAGFLSLDIENLFKKIDEENGEDEYHSTEIIPTQSSTSQGIFDQKEPEEADHIFEEVGRRLRQQREILGLSLDEIERHTYLKEHYLRALEEGRLEGLPSPVQGRGMLKNYATFLGIDSDSLLLRFADGLQARLAANHARTKSTRPKSTPKKPILPASFRRLISSDVIIGVALIVALITFISWGAVRIYAMSSSQTPTATAPSIADVLLASPTASPSLTPEPITPTTIAEQIFPTLILATDSESGDLLLSSPQEEKIEVTINVQQRTWLRVIIDGETVLDDRVIPGSPYPFSASTSIEVLTGNGAALQIFFNGIDLGALGVNGEVVRKIYSIEGIITATPTVSPTPTATLPETPSPPISSTPLPEEATIPVNP